jgi:glucitol operon activator protein
MVTTLITLAAIAWIAQLALGGWQIHQFNRAFEQLCQRGRVGVGRAGGRFQPRVIIAVALDEQLRVTDSLLMKGLTVFTRPLKIAALTGKHPDELHPDVIFPHDPRCQNALSLALKMKHG